MNKFRALGISVLFVMTLAQCSDSTASDTDVAPATGVVISNPQTISSVTTVSDGALVEGGTVAYVSAPPGSFPDAQSGTVRNATRNGSTHSFTLIDGGFDPIAIDAREGDELGLTLMNAAGAPMRPVSVRVPRRRPPSVVRTIPSKGRIDVALNVVIEVVFTEPLNKPSVSSASIVLMENGAAVPADVELSADGLSLTVRPRSLLQVRTAYSLRGDGVRDFDNDALDDAQITTFVTGDLISTLGPVPDIERFTATSDSGLIIGRHLDDPYTFSFWRDGVTQTLSRRTDPIPFVMPSSVNNAGTVVGWGLATVDFEGRSYVGIHAVQWKAGATSDLGTLPGHNRSDAYAITNSGLVIGASSIWDGGMDSCCDDIRPVIWKNGAIEELHDFQPVAFNSKSEILGISSGRFELWSDGIITPLAGGVLDQRESQAEFGVAAINDNRQIAGTYNGHVFIWENSQSEMLPDPPDCQRSQATDMDNRGRIVGYTFCNSAPSERAVVWIDRKPFILPGGWVALSINEIGEIFGQADGQPQPGGLRAIMWRLKTP